MELDKTLEKILKEEYSAKIIEQCQDCRIGSIHENFLITSSYPGYLADLTIELVNDDIKFIYENGGLIMHYDSLKALCKVLKNLWNSYV